MVEAWRRTRSVVRDLAQSQESLQAHLQSLEVWWQLSAVRQVSVEFPEASQYPRWPQQLVESVQSQESLQASLRSLEVSCLETWRRTRLAVREVSVKSPEALRCPWCPQQLLESAQSQESLQASLGSLEVSFLET